MLEAGCIEDEGDEFEALDICNGQPLASGIGDWLMRGDGAFSAPRRKFSISPLSLAREDG
jgi:hypothetical protein